MLLKKISISHLGGIKNFSRDFTNSLNVVKGRYSDELCCAITAVLHNKSTSCMPPIWICRESRIDAVVSINKKTFHIRITPNEDLNEIKLSAFDELDQEVTAEYLYLTSHCAEHDLSDIFNGNEKHAFLRILNCLNEPEISDRSADGLLHIKAFRSYAFDYVQNFKPEPLREGKRYEIVLEKNGLYGVRCMDDGEQPVYLSESEQTLFRYLCFLKTAEFWQGFEEIRNLHSVKKPFVIKDLLERLDESIDISALFDRTLNLGRQIIVLT